MPGVKNIPFYAGGQAVIRRHPLNDRRQDKVLEEYTKSVKEKGIVRGVRGDAWVCACVEKDGQESETQTYWALTFATLTLGANVQSHLPFAANSVSLRSFYGLLASVY